jgi:hypothetical protein
LSHSSPKSEQAADAILALINSRPRTPNRDELAAVIDKAMSASDVEAEKNRAEWNELTAQARAARAKLRSTPCGSDAEVRASDTRLHDCAVRILAEAARGPKHVRLPAYAALWLLGFDLPGTDAIS